MFRGTTGHGLSRRETKNGRRGPDSPSMSSQRAGMAVFIVVMVAAVIGIFVVIVIFHGRDTRRKGVEKRDRAQAYYLARGAHNHFLLKLRCLLPEFYDATSYAVGKNPLFEFSTAVDSIQGNMFNPQGGRSEFGPMFFTGTNPGNVTVADGRIVINRSSEGDGIHRNDSTGFAASPENRAKMEYLLNHYNLDVCSDYPESDPDKAIVTVSATPHKEVAQFGVTDQVGTSSISNNARIDGWVDPFNGSYFVSSVRVLGVGGLTKEKTGHKYGQTSVLVVTEATVRKDNQVSLVTRQGGRLKPLVVQRETKTSLKQEQGWLEVKEERESQSSYERRAVSSGDRTSESGKRTEICTAVYFVTRETKTK